MTPVIESPPFVISKKEEIAMQWGKILRVLGMFGFVAILAMMLTSTALAGGGVVSRADCTINGEGFTRGLSNDGDVRLHQGDTVLLGKLKIDGGRCNVDFTTNVDMIVNSSQGEIFVDGARRDHGNSLRVTGSRLEIRYGGANGANGFDVLFVPLAPPPPPPPPPGISTLIGGVTFNPAGRAVGSCDHDMVSPEWARVRTNLPYFPNNGRLDMTGILDNLRTANATMWVQCHVQAGPNGALVEVATGNVELLGGQNLTTTYPPGFQNAFGIAVNDH